MGTVLEIGPLDVLYWSADDYHVAVSDTNDFQAALSVGIYHQGSNAEVMGSLDFLGAATKADGLDIHGVPGATEGTLSGQAVRNSSMAGFFDRWEQLRDMLNRPGEDEYRALGLAARLVTSAGYGKVRTVPSGSPPPLAGTVLLCAVPESLIVSHVRGGLLVGANGSAFFYEQPLPAMEEAIRRLRRGLPLRFEDLLGAVEAAPGGNDKMTALILDLLNAGALSIPPAAQERV